MIYVKDLFPGAITTNGWGPDQTINEIIKTEIPGRFIVSYSEKNSNWITHSSSLRMEDVWNSQGDIKNPLPKKKLLVRDLL